MAEYISMVPEYWNAEYVIMDEMTHFSSNKILSWDGEYRHYYPLIDGEADTNVPILMLATPLMMKSNAK